MADGIKGTTDIAGHHIKTWMVIAVAIGGSAAAYFVWKNHEASASAASAATASGTVTDPGSGVSYPANSTDPTTGMTYSAEIGEYGSVSAADSAVSTEQQNLLTNSGDLYGTGYESADYSTGTYGAGTAVSGSVYTSNSAWAQAVTAGLEDIGYSGTDVSSALGSYLTGTPVTSDAAAIIKAAISEYGNAPVGSFQIIAQPAAQTTSAALNAVPNVVGETLTEAQTHLKADGFVYHGPGGSASDSGKATVSSQSPAAGTKAHAGTTVTVASSYKAPAAAAKKSSVPRVAGETAAVATAHLIADGFKVDSGGLAVNVVITGTSPAAGASAAHGTKVTLQGDPKHTVPKTAST